MTDLEALKNFELRFENVEKNILASAQIQHTLHCRRRRLGSVTLRQSMIEEVYSLLIHRLWAA